jgi:hypothetical protein
MLDNSGYRPMLRICSTYCSSTATVVSRTRLNVTLYVHCLSCAYCIGFLRFLIIVFRPRDYFAFDQKRNAHGEPQMSWEAVIIVVQGRSPKFSEESHTRLKCDCQTSIRIGRLPECSLLNILCQSVGLPGFPTLGHFPQQFAFHPPPQSQVPHPHKRTRTDRLCDCFSLVREWHGVLNSLISHLCDRCRLHISLCLCRTCKVTEVGVIYPSDNNQSMALISNFRAAGQPQ